jgi:hypothetical protein
MTIVMLIRTADLPRFEHAAYLVVTTTRDKGVARLQPDPVADADTRTKFGVPRG